MKKYNVYIDEAGDLGYQRGTQWFVLTAVIVDSDDEPAIRTALSQLKVRLNLHEIHFRKAGDFFNKALITQGISHLPFTYTNVIVDTNKLNLTMRSDSATAYNYICRMLLERISWYLRDSGAIGDIILSARGTSRDYELIRYISLLLCSGRNEIAPNVIRRVTARPAGSWDLLQMADVCATATFYGYQKNPKGFSVPCYTKAIEQHLYRRNGNLSSYGLKFFDKEMTPDYDELMLSWPCAK